MTQPQPAMLLSVLGCFHRCGDEWGQPRNFSSDIPFQRPEEFGYREFLTPEEISTIQTRLSADAAGAYHFWYEMAPIADTVRAGTGSRRATDAQGQRPVRTGSGGIGKDGPEDRGLPNAAFLA